MATPDDVRAARNAAGLSQRALGERLGVSDKTLRDYERGVPGRMQSQDQQAALDAFVAEQLPGADPGTAAAAPRSAGDRLRAAANDLDLMSTLAARIAGELRAVAGELPHA